MKENVLIGKSIDFGARIVRLYRYLTDTKHETVLSKQVLRSGTSIGANINEAQYGNSKADFIAKPHIALKETAETEYWLHILQKSEYLDNTMASSSPPSTRPKTAKAEMPKHKNKTGFVKPSPVFFMPSSLIPPDSTRFCSNRSTRKATDSCAFMTVCDRNCLKCQSGTDIWGCAMGRASVRSLPWQFST